MKALTKAGEKSTPAYTVSSYVGNGSADGTFVAGGFSPRAVIMKNFHTNPIHAVYVKQVGPLWHVRITEELDGARWFLRKNDAVAFIVGLRMQRDDLTGIEEALQQLE